MAPPAFLPILLSKQKFTTRNVRAARPRRNSSSPVSAASAIGTLSLTLLLDKDDLMRAVPDEHINAMLTQQDQLLDAVVDLDGLERWRDVLISFNRQRDGTFGCVLGAAVPELADRDEQARQKLARYFAHWQSLAANALRRLQSIGKLRDEAKPDALATGLIAALQGGYILAQASRDVDDMAAALDMALDHVRSFAVRP